MRMFLGSTSSESQFWEVLLFSFSLLTKYLSKNQICSFQMIAIPHYYHYYNHFVIVFIIIIIIILFYAEKAIEYSYSWMLNRKAN